MTRSQGKAYRHWVVQKVHTYDPDISSSAALVLLAKKCFQLDKDIYTDTRMQRIREKWIKKLMKTPDEAGGLTCAICGRKGLRLDADNRFQIATLDHIINVSEGGPWNDVNNFRVACYSCNSKRNEKKQGRGQSKSHKMKQKRLDFLSGSGKLVPQT